MWELNLGSLMEYLKCLLRCEAVGGLERSKGFVVGD